MTIGTASPYACAKDIESFLLSQVSFDVNSTPKQGQIERYILKAAGEFEARTGTAWQPVFVTQEVHHLKSTRGAYPEIFNASWFSVPRPIKLEHSPICPWDATRGHKIEAYEGDDGTVSATAPEGSWTDFLATKTHSREGDFWTDLQQGILHIRKSFIPRQYKLFRITYEYGMPIPTLNGALTSSATTVTLTSTYRFPTRGFVRIDNEWIIYSGKTATTLTGCVRGAKGSTAAAHSDAVEAYYVPEDVHGLIVQKAAALYLQNEVLIATVAEGQTSGPDFRSKIEMWNKEFDDAVNGRYARWSLL